LGSRTTGAPRSLSNARASGSHTPGQAQVWRGACVVALLTLVVFLPALQGEFVSWDDNLNFVENASYRGLGVAQLRWMWTTFHLGHYTPLTWMSLGLDYLLWGMNPRGYHATSIALHAMNATLLYFIALRVYAAASGRPARVASAAVAALFFALHPLRVESVAWITERRDVLSLFFALATVLCYLRYAQHAAATRRWYALAIIAFAAALLSKATAVTIPGALLVLNVYPLRRLGGPGGWWTEEARRVWLELIPFAVLAAATAALSLVALQPIRQLTPAGKVVVSAYSLMFYLIKTLLPLDLAPLYEMHLVRPASAVYVASCAAVAALAIAIWRARMRYPAVTAATVAFVLIVLPLLGVVQNGPQIVADRYTYHASPALALLAGTFIPDDGRARARLGWASLVLVAISALTWMQIRVWRTSQTVWSRVLRIDSTSSIGNNNYGAVLAQQGRSADAIEYYRRAIAARPSYADAHNNLGLELALQEKPDEAIAHYRRALEIKSDYVEAEINWANALLLQQRFDSAVAHYRHAAQLGPNHAGVYLNWGVAMARQNRLREAVQLFERAADLDPSLPEARMYLGQALEDLRRQGPNPPSR